MVSSTYLRNPPDYLLAGIELFGVPLGLAKLGYGAARVLLDPRQVAVCRADGAQAHREPGGNLNLLSGTKTDAEIWAGQAADRRSRIARLQLVQNAVHKEMKHMKMKMKMKMEHSKLNAAPLGISCSSLDGARIIVVFSLHLRTWHKQTHASGGTGGPCE
jgi:hypothetical protein